ncbi:DUF2129 domain-containing protein [Haploplasma axanthum]|uniref:Uncharacterized protein conserved in bacteria n=1 Tax=Haploplasma axanthum TaxID=29552 RepID=A0A449BFL4_HAPAX|nr:DUF2129 domain-containing protein [Haploplasma axanthum]VEU81221.1 Uncharacterized protein conserved in bacteria [Haploplasma axanthum]
MVIVDRMAFIVYFQGNEIVKRIEKMPVNIAYVSKKANYLVFYGDKKQEKSYFNQLKTIRGFKKFEMSQLFNEEYNFKLE